MTKQEKLLNRSAELVLKLSQLPDNEFEEAVEAMKKQYQNLQGKEFEICDMCYSNIFEVARSVRS